MKGSRVSGSVRALRGRGDLAQVLSPHYVNPTAAKRAGTTQRRAGGKKEERERGGRLQPTEDGSTGSAKWQQSICVALDGSLEPAQTKSFTESKLEKP